MRENFYFSTKKYVDEKNPGKFNVTIDAYDGAEVFELV